MRTTMYLRHLVEGFVVVAVLLLSVHAFVHQDTAPARAQEVLSEEDPGWNCLTMGNHQCGPIYKRVTSEMADALAEGDRPEMDWNSCLTDQHVVVCADGTVVTL